MKLINTAKRNVVLIAIAAGATSLWLAVPSQATCPLPASSTTSTTSSSNANSPGNQQQSEAVLHNGKVLCLPTSAAAAHMRHGDQDLGPCDKRGNNTPGA